jgi:CRISPR/Cas system-associated exonuclease Cas4 (RecB family)
MDPNPQLFEAYLKCPTKCWLQSRGETGEGNAYAEWVRAQNESYRAEGVRRLQEAVPEGERVVAPLRENLKAAKWRLAQVSELVAFKGAAPGTV